MPKLTQFDPPANRNDFLSGEEEKESTFRARWSDNINRFTEQALQNDPWSSVNQPSLTQYYNPLNMDVPAEIKGTAIQWTAFPNRILIRYSSVGQLTQWKYGDEGPPASDNYSPSGPRGWQDEYCEWSVTRNEEGKITKVMFTCENREYWYTLWDIDPNVVLRLYQELIGSQITLEDLCLRDNNKIIIDPATGRPVYNDLNPWNSTTTEGAVHLISNPNALGAEIFLAGQATILRQNGGNPITDKNELINCSRYGTANRNSDPTIGAGINGLVRGTGASGSGVRVSLKNPVGLYIQEPSFDTYQLPLSAPSEAQPSDYWKIVRGKKRQDGDEIDYILHAVYEVPKELGFTISDITINGFNIEYGAQIAQTFQIALVGLPLPQLGAPESLPCADDSIKPLPRPYILRELQMLGQAQRSGLNMQIEQGTTVKNVGLYAFNSDTSASVEFTGGTGVTVERTGFEDMQGAQLFILTITATPDAPLGNYSILLKKSDGSHGPAAYGLLEVVLQGTLNRTEAPAAAAMAAHSITASMSVGLPTRQHT